MEESVEGMDESEKEKGHIMPFFFHGHDIVILTTNSKQLWLPELPHQQSIMFRLEVQGLALPNPLHN